MNKFFPCLPPLPCLILMPNAQCPMPNAQCPMPVVIPFYQSIFTILVIML
ncbi:hypothetical protein LC574_19015 [Nostoc sp. CHAB 5715]|nr:hypothetical protein [Nostoc sp. CHAB 5715]